MLAQDEGLTAPLRTVSQPDGTSPAAQLPRPGTVKARLTLLAYSPQVARVKSRRARWLVRVRSRGCPVQ